VLSRVLIKKQRGRRGLTLIAIASLLAMTLGISGSALAVHDEEFQLDANIADDAALTEDFDWENFFDPNGTPAGSVPGAEAVDPLPAGFDAAGFDSDFTVKANGSFNTADGSTFATGSKDTLPITPGWQCNLDNNVNSKTDVMNAYAVSYTADGDGGAASGDEILYFGLERNTNTGTGNVGFWFLQDEVACESTGGATAFTGDHVDGDVLVVSEFTNGGVVSTIQVYKWSDADGPGGDPGFLDPNSVAGGINLDCGIVTGGDSVCANVNTENITDIPWLTANFKDGVGHTLRSTEFFEAGLNLTEEGLGGKCFNTFIADTRSSTSLTATIFDFSLGTLGSCTSTTVTTPLDSSDADPDGTDIPLTGTLAVHDSALITVTGADTFDATVTFFLCGPGSLDVVGDDTDNPALCDVSGVQIGTPIAVTANGTYESVDALLTAAGDYCFRAEFSGDATAGVPPSKDASAGECFTIDPVQPALVTQATVGPVDFGDPITDTVTLSGTANDPGSNGTAPETTINATRGNGADGTIHVDVYGPDSCAADDIVHSADLAVNGDAAYGGAGSAIEFTPDAPGQYVFVASYNGDSPNTLGIAATACAAQPDAEKVIVQQIPTSITTAPSWVPNDSATVTSTVSGELLPEDGTITFSLYRGTTGATAQENCLAGGATGREYTKSFLTGAAAQSQTKSSDNTTSYSTDLVLYWLVTYDPGDTAFLGIQSECVEAIDVDVTGDSGPGTAFP
jgi:hypothetical protein